MERTDTTRSAPEGDVLESPTRLAKEFQAAEKDFIAASRRLKLAAARLKSSLTVLLENDPVAEMSKPKTHVYQEIIAEHGAPMHAADITAEALRRGVTFAIGKLSPVRQVRESLQSSGRFENIGRNTWRLRGVTAIETRSATAA